jgi:hypothetical protein
VDLKAENNDYHHCQNGHEINHNFYKSNYYDLYPSLFDPSNLAVVAVVLLIVVVVHPAIPVPSTF